MPGSLAVDGEPGRLQQALDPALVRESWGMIASRDVYDVARDLVDRHGPQAREIASDFTATIAGDPELLMYYSAVTALVTRPDGNSCIVAHGKDWIWIPVGSPGQIS